MYSYGLPHMAGQKQDNQLEHTYSSYVRIRDVTLKTCQRWWTIGRSGERGSGISVPVARHDDDEVKERENKRHSKYLFKCLHFDYSSNFFQQFNNIKELLDTQLFFEAQFITTIYLEVKDTLQESKYPRRVASGGVPISN